MSSSNHTIELTRSFTQVLRTESSGSIGYSTGTTTIVVSGLLSTVRRKKAFDHQQMVS